MFTKKKSGRKLGVTLLAVVLLMAGTICGTLAWLTAESDDVTNTFTVGDIEIELKEHELKEDGILDVTNEVTENNNYKIVPDDTQPKDPFVRIKKDSEKCYVYVCVENELVIKDANEQDVVVATYNINAHGWTKVAESGNKILYRFNEIVDASTQDEARQVFSTITYDGAMITEDNISGLGNKKIAIRAYAHQSENTTQDVADAAAKAHFEVNVATP